MPVSAQDTIFHHIANGITVTFAFGCQVLQAADLKVFVNDVRAMSGFSISGLGVPTGGAITFDAAPPNLAQVRIERDIVLERQNDYQQNGDFLARVVNPDFNRLWMALQQHLAILSRSLMAPKSDSIAPAPLPSVVDRANKLLSFDAAGNPVAVLPDAQSATALQLLLATSSGASLMGFKREGAGTVQRSVHSKLKESVSAEDFGAVGDGIADDTGAIQAALNAVGYGGEVRLLSKLYYVTGLVIPQYVTLSGTFHSPGYDGLAGSDSFKNLRCVLLLNPAGTIAMKQSTSLRNCTVFNSVIARGVLPAQNAAGFSGTAITMGNIPQQCPDMLVENVAIFGFNLGIFAKRCINSKIRHVNLDCVNGISCDTGGNPIDIQWVLGWPFISVAYSPYAPANITRSGYGIKLQNNMDATRLEFCTFYNWAQGFVLNNTNGVTLIGCGADAPELATVNATGLTIQGACGITQVIGCQFVANTYGIVMDTADPQHLLILTNQYFVANILYDLDVKCGSVLCSGVYFGSSGPFNSVRMVQAVGQLAIDSSIVEKNHGTLVNAADTGNVKLGAGIFYRGSNVVPISAALSSMPTAPSAEGVALPLNGNVLKITGTNNVFSFSGGVPGRLYVLNFSGVLTLSDSPALQLAGNFVSSATSSITLLCLTPGTMQEVARSNN